MPDSSLPGAAPGKKDRLFLPLENVVRKGGSLHGHAGRMRVEIWIPSDAEGAEIDRIAGLLLGATLVLEPLAE